jgi:hypothetical protein
MKNILKVILYIVLTLTAFFFIIWCMVIIRYVWYVHIIKTDFGEPVYKNERIVKDWSNQLTVAQRVALHKFPDLNSCIEAKTNNPSVEELMIMDWSKIKTSSQVEICAFRILKTLGDISYATPWLEQQGYSSPKNFSSENPFKEHEGNLRVDGVWSVTKKGLRYPESGLKHEIISLPIFFPPYSVGIYTTWSSDGKDLLYVQAYENRL